MEEEAYDDFYGYPCYEFEDKLDRRLDDWHCRHCRKFLTVECDHIDEFLEAEFQEEY